MVVTVLGSEGDAVVTKVRMREKACVTVGVVTNTMCLNGRGVPFHMQLGVVD